MFTGIIESTGTVTRVDDHGSRSQITITSEGFGGDLQHGESIAVDGVCLTVSQHDGNEWVADVMRVTRATTTLGAIGVGDRVNLERAMRADGRLGGHMVQGHVDGVATLIARDSQAEWDDFTLDVPEHMQRYLVPKGSVTINGVSLTVAALDGNQVTVSLIPTTLSDTTLNALAVGDKVNVEVDVIAKYVERMLAERS
ncbi:MAG: riboflavin synthase [Actinobacteria bacterium HGW-Actinobacteria-4]|nr:MAG: riboflavin synthase [Actinobacteria bacterium HGW-Actinobacteria-4]